MTLYTHVEAQPASLFELARYFTDMGDRVDTADGGAADARGKSQPWEGEAAEGFRVTATRMHREGAELEQLYYNTHRIVANHAEDMRVVHERMQAARGTAANGGLKVTPIEIEDPGPAPPKPEPSPGGSTYGGTARGADSAEEHKMMAAYNEWADKAVVYAECSTMVAEARTIEQKSQNDLLDAVKGVAPDKPIITTSNVLTGVAAGYLARQTNLRTTAASFSKVATEAAEVGNNATHSAAARGRNLTLSLVSEARANVAEAKANTSKIGTWLEKQPQPVKKALTLKLSKTFPKGRPYVTRAPIVFKRIPALGTAFSGAAIAVDAMNGKDVTRSVVTNGSGLLAGAAWGFVAGGPIGALASKFRDLG